MEESLSQQTVPKTSKFHFIFCSFVSDFSGKSGVIS